MENSKIIELSGRELDAAIAVELGWRLLPDAKPNPMWYDGEDKLFNSPRPYSSDGNAMLELIGVLASQGYCIEIAGHEFGWQCRIGNVAFESADTLPLAVARAVMVALTTGKEHCA